MEPWGVNLVPNDLNQQQEDIYQEFIVPGKQNWGLIRGESVQEELFKSMHINKVQFNNKYFEVLVS